MCNGKYEGEAGGAMGWPMGEGGGDTHLDPLHYVHVGEDTPVRLEVRWAVQQRTYGGKLVCLSLLVQELARPVRMFAHLARHAQKSAHVRDTHRRHPLLGVRGNAPHWDLHLPEPTK